MAATEWGETAAAVWECCHVEDEQQDMAQDGESCHCYCKCGGTDPRASGFGVMTDEGMRDESEGVQINIGGRDAARCLGLHAQVSSISPSRYALFFESASLCLSASVLRTWNVLFSPRFDLLESCSFIYAWFSSDLALHIQYYFAPSQLATHPLVVSAFIFFFSTTFFRFSPPQSILFCSRPASQPPCLCL